jgi:hypothetical protein
LIFDILFIFISTLSAIRCPQSTVYSPPSTVCQTSNIELCEIRGTLSTVHIPPSTVICPKADPSCLKAATNYDKLCKTNPITKRLKMNVTNVLTKGYENKRLFRRAENKPKQTQFSPSLCCAMFSPASEVRITTNHVYPERSRRELRTAPAPSRPFDFTALKPSGFCITLRRSFRGKQVWTYFA